MNVVNLSEIAAGSWQVEAPLAAFDMSWLNKEAKVSGRLVRGRSYSLQGRMVEDIFVVVLLAVGP